MVAGCEVRIPVAPLGSARTVAPTACGVLYLHHSNPGNALSITRVLLHLMWFPRGSKGIILQIIDRVRSSYRGKRSNLPLAAACLSGVSGSVYHSQVSGVIPRRSVPRCCCVVATGKGCSQILELRVFEHCAWIWLTGGLGPTIPGRVPLIFDHFGSSPVLGGMRSRGCRPGQGMFF
ncbi:hypothetical protein CCHOA_08535 [Corynebacterium choanae]|uniref:Uncharacterized protein n=1 Tax=Corynebacterium choanae TaxID=1862358 RepID=A0A3G6J7X7_9CORY|nr:hypothetical protein CCHOA_08535 [Corynebacterium choanae]